MAEYLLWNEVCNNHISAVGLYCLQLFVWTLFLLNFLQMNKFEDSFQKTKSRHELIKPQKLNDQLKSQNFPFQLQKCLSYSPKLSPKFLKNCQQNLTKSNNKFSVSVAKMPKLFSQVVSKIPEELSTKSNRKNCQQNLWGTTAKIKCG